MGLEKFDDAIAEYLETKRKHTRDALKLADLSDSDIEKYCADIEKEIQSFITTPLLEISSDGGAHVLCWLILESR